MGGGVYCYLTDGGNGESDDNITGDSPVDGNGDSTIKRANSIRPYEIIQLLH